jgi:damage-control phosphatase, subfamily I
MKVFLECLPCLLRQVLDATKTATDDADLRNTIMTEALEMLRGYGSFPNAPTVARGMQRLIKAHTGNADPYAAIKQSDLALALRLLPDVRQQVESRDDSLYWALKAAATGNLLDCAAGTRFDAERFTAEFETLFAVCDDAAFRERLQTAQTLLVIGDNAGETVFDGLLLSQFPHLRRTYAVRSAPAINDATAADALASGLDAYADILPTGCDAPGVLLSECSETFLERFYASDIVISKGQGNLETLSDCPREIFFLLKAKCPAVAGLLGVDLYAYVFRHREYRPDKA